MRDFFNKFNCVIFGCNEQASAVAVNLKKTGFPVIMVARESENVLRRKLSFKDALMSGKKTINNITANTVSEDAHYYKFSEDSVYYKKFFNQIKMLQKDNEFPLLSLMEYSIYQQSIKPQVLIHTLMENQNLPDIEMAEQVISLNPAAVPGLNCHLYIESAVTEKLGELYWESTAEKKNADVFEDTYIIKAKKEGAFVSHVIIGDIVKKNRLLADIKGEEIISAVAGKIIGLRHSGEIVGKNEPIIEIDENIESVKDKEYSLKKRYLSMAVLQGILFSLKNSKF